MIAAAAPAELFALVLTIPSRVMKKENPGGRAELSPGSCCHGQKLIL